MADKKNELLRPFEALAEVGRFRLGGRKFFNHMNQKGFANIILVVVVIILVGAGAYFALNRQITPPVPTPTPSPTLSPTPSPTPISNSTPIPNTPNQVDNKWKTFQSSRFTFQFEYPAEWSVLDKTDDPYGVEFWVAEKNMATAIMDVESGINLSLIGISYCGAYPQDKRCESLKTESGGYVTIDWDASGKANAMFSSQDGTFGVSFTLHKVNSETKNIFRKILSTFKFLK